MDNNYLHKDLKKAKELEKVKEIEEDKPKEVCSRIYSFLVRHKAWDSFIVDLSSDTNTLSLLLLSYQVVFGI